MPVPPGDPLIMSPEFGTTVPIAESVSAHRPPSRISPLSGAWRCGVARADTLRCCSPARKRGASSGPLPGRIRHLQNWSCCGCCRVNRMRSPSSDVGHLPVAWNRTRLVIDHAAFDHPRRLLISRTQPAGIAKPKPVSACFLAVCRSEVPLTSPRRLADVLRLESVFCNSPPSTCETAPTSSRNTSPASCSRSAAGILQVRRIGRNQAPQSKRGGSFTLSVEVARARAGARRSVVPRSTKPASG